MAREQNRESDTGCEAAKSYALKLLSYRDRSEQELRSKLLKKGFSDALVSEVVFNLKSYGFLDDERFASLLIRHEKSKLNSRRAVLAALSLKGIPRELAQSLLEEIYPLHEELEIIGKLYLKKASRIQSDADVARFARLLSARGFEPESIALALKSLKRGGI